MQRWHGVFCASGRGPFRFRTQVQVPQQQGGTHPLSLGASYRSAEEAARVHDLALLAILGPKVRKRVHVLAPAGQGGGGRIKLPASQLQLRKMQVWRRRRLACKVSAPSALCCCRRRPAPRR